MNLLYSKSSDSLLRTTSQMLSAFIMIAGLLLVPLLSYGASAQSLEQSPFPKGLIVRGPWLEECLAQLEKSFQLLDNNKVNATKTIRLSGSQYIDKYAASIVCRDKQSGRDVWAFVRQIYPNTIQLNPTMVKDSRFADISCEFGMQFTNATYWSRNGTILIREIDDCDWRFQEHENNMKLFAAIVIHEARHTQQWNNPGYYIPFVAALRSKSMEWDATKMEALALKELGWKMNIFSLDENEEVQYSYETFLQGKYYHYYKKPMPPAVYKQLFGKDPPIAVQSSTREISPDVKELLEKQY